MKIALLLPMLTGCAAPMAAGQATDPLAIGGVMCDATKAQALVGKPRTAATVEQARTLSGARQVRDYVTGSALTMDFRTDRLNVEFDDRGRITRINCG